jgi:hypothetical protein
MSDTPYIRPPVDHEIRHELNEYEARNAGHLIEGRMLTDARAAFRGTATL